MPDDKPNETDTEGKETDNSTEEVQKPLSLYDKTEAIVTRQEEANKKAEEILDRQEKLHANQRLAGTGGGAVPKVEVSEEKQKAEQSSQFWGDSALGDTVRKANKDEA